MTIHRVRLYYSNTGATSFHGWLSTWLTNMQPWSGGEVANSVPDAPTSPFDSDLKYYSVELAFDWSEDKSIILDQLDGYVSAYCDWSRLGYHVCDHDEDDRTGCQWEEIRENGSVSSDVPVLE